MQQSFEDAELKKAEGEEEEGKPDPLTQLVTTFCRGAMTERSGALQVCIDQLNWQINLFINESKFNCLKL